MEENIETNLDLQKILATLANLHKPEGISDASAQQQYGLGQTDQSAQNTSQTYVHKQSIPYHAPVDPRLAGRPAPQQRSTSKLQDQNTGSVVDPSTITEWKQGLRCVSKIASQNPEFAPTIRKLMKEQDGNVKQWEGGRARLIDDQKLKKENEQTHRAVLSLPGLLENTPLMRTPEQEQEELNQYDAKVYRASKVMVESQTSSLKVLGVPFFGTKPHLILHENEELAPADATTDCPGGGTNQKISKEQLLVLQRKMLIYLMDLYGD